MRLKSISDSPAELASIHAFCEELAASASTFSPLALSEQVPPEYWRADLLARPLRAVVVHHRQLPRCAGTIRAPVCPGSSIAVKIGSFSDPAAG